MCSEAYPRYCPRSKQRSHCYRANIDERLSSAKLWINIPRSRASDADNIDWAAREANEYVQPLDNNAEESKYARSSRVRRTLHRVAALDVARAALAHRSRGSCRSHSDRLRGLASLAAWDGVRCGDRKDGERKERESLGEVHCV